MIWVFAIGAVLLWCVLATLYMLGSALLRFPERTVDDVVGFLRPVDLDHAALLLDPGSNHELRWKLDPETFSEIQRKRMHAYLELVRRMAHNARVLVEFGNQEAQLLEGSGERRTARQTGAIQALQQEAVKVRLYSLLTILKLRVLLAIRPMQSPPLTWFRTAGHVDGLRSYEALREASRAVFEEFNRPVDKLLLNF